VSVAPLPRLAIPPAPIAQVADRTAMRAAAPLAFASWKLVAERLNVNEAVAVDAYRHHRLPPGVSAEAAAAFA
jgi:hypothetical protein